MSFELTDTFVKTATAGGKATKDYFDEKEKGFHLRVSAGGKKSYSLLYVSPVNGGRVRMPLGETKHTTLKEARQRARKANIMVDDGRDPVAEERAAQAGKRTMAELIESRLAMEVRGQLRAAADLERRFTKNVIPLIGDLPVTDFRMMHLHKVLDPIKKRGAPREAAKVYLDMTKLFNFAIERDEWGIEVTPIRRGSKRSKTVIDLSINKRTRWLTQEEICTVWFGMDQALKKAVFVPDILRLCMLLATRISEVCGMERSEIDQKNRMWIIPKERVKNNTDHKLPLPPMAWAIIQERLRRTNGKYLFPQIRKADGAIGPISHEIVDRTLNRAHQRTKKNPQGRFGGMEPWTPHDLRRTFKTNWSMERNGFGLSEKYAEAVLNHRTALADSSLDAHYNQNDYLDEKRTALFKWEAWLRVILGIDAEELMAAE